ncbi:methyl-accepting chemotaxis protein, partial [Helicobacter didelphidarum]
MSIKIKVVLVSSIISVIAMITLSIISMIMNKQVAIESTITAQANKLQVVDMLIMEQNESIKTSLLALAKEISEMPISYLDSKENIIQNVGPLLKLHKDSSGLVASYIGLPTGEVVESATNTDKAGIPFQVRGGQGTDYMVNTRDWYVGAAKKNGFYQTEVMVDSITGKLSFSYGFPIVKNGRFIGVVGVDILLNDVQKYFEALKAHNKGGIFALDSTNTPFVATDNSILMQKNSLYDEISKMSQQTKDFEAFNIIDNGINKVAQCKSFEHPEFANYTLCSLESVEDIEAPIMHISYIQIGISVIFSILVSLILYIVINIVLRSLDFISQGLFRFFRFLNHEEKSIELISLKSKDEIGAMAMAINENIEKTRKGLEQDSHVVKEVVYI